MLTLAHILIFSTDTHTYTQCVGTNTLAHSHARLILSALSHTHMLDVSDPVSDPPDVPFGAIIEQWSEQFITQQRLQL